MKFFIKEKVLSKKWFLNYFLLLLGSFIMAVGYVFFISPNKIVPGGVYGISIVIHYITTGVLSFFPNGFPIGLMGLILNIPLTIIGIKILGPRFGVKTVIGFVLTSVFIDWLTYLWGDEPLVHDDILLSCIFGGLLIGLGLGLIFKSKATSGGSDIVAMIFAKYTKLPLGQLIVYIDSVVVLFGLIIFKDWKVPLYSLIVIFITGKVVDIVLEGMSYEKTLFIISDKYKEIGDKITNNLNRSGTLLSGKGIYKGSKKNIIFTVVNRRELALLENYINNIDPNAFLTVINANEILGNGFKPLKEKMEE
jgi:uncharacterized membrane-anchored protein YitT (DUF2179 family)